MSFRKKMAKFVKTKGGKGAIIGTTAFLLVGVLALLLGYGIGEGWDVVAAWFVSRYAMYFYVGAGFYVIIVCYIIVLSKVFGDE